jgi:hypothetical protein
MRARRDHCKGANMTTAAKQPSAYEPSPVFLMAEWRRAGMPGEVRAVSDAPISVCTKGGQRTMITADSVTAVLQHLPTAKNASEVVVRVFQRIFAESHRQDNDYSESAAALDVLRPRVMSVLRKEFLAIRVMAGALQERIDLDAYVLAIEAKMRTDEPNESFDGGDEHATRPRATGNNDRQPCLLPELSEPIALLSYAERIRAGSGAGTAAFWELACEELAGTIRSALAELELGGSEGEPSVVGSPENCPSCGAVKEFPSAGRCLECAMSALVGKHALEVLPGRPVDKAHPELFEFGRGAATLALAAASLTASAKPAAEPATALVPHEQLRALRTALSYFGQAAGAAIRNLHRVVVEPPHESENPRG